MFPNKIFKCIIEYLLTWNKDRKKRIYGSQANDYEEWKESSQEAQKLSTRRFFISKTCHRRFECICILMNEELREIFWWKRLEEDALTWLLLCQSAICINKIEEISMHLIITLSTTQWSSALEIFNQSESLKLAWKLEEFNQLQHHQTTNNRLWIVMLAAKCYSIKSAHLSASSRHLILALSCHAEEFSTAQ